MAKTRKKSTSRSAAVKKAWVTRRKLYGASGRKKGSGTRKKSARKTAPIKDKRMLGMYLHMDKYGGVKYKKRKAPYAAATNARKRKSAAHSRSISAKRKGRRR